MKKIGIDNSIADDAIAEMLCNDSRAEHALRLIMQKYGEPL